MYVEDLLLAIRDRLDADWPSFPYRRQDACFDGLLDDDWHRGFISSVGEHVAAGKQLSTNQSQSILKLIARVRHPLVRLGVATDNDIDRMLYQPEFRRPLYESVNIPREVRYLGDNILGFRFKFNGIIQAHVVGLGQPVTTDWARLHRTLDLLPKPHFNWERRIWLVPVLRHNLSKITALINEYRFGTDAPVMAYLRLARHSYDQPSTFTVKDGVILGTICDNPVLAAWVTDVSDGIAL
jgi:hypothetical protein